MYISETKVLSHEQLARATNINKELSGIDAINLARNLADTFDVAKNKERGVYLEKGNRQYRLEKVNGVVEIIGFVLPRSDRDAPLYDQLESVKRMLPVTIHTNGVITSEGVRLSPYDQRLSILASDLLSPTPITPMAFRRNARIGNEKP